MSKILKMIFNALKSLSLKNLLVLVGLFLRHPFFAALTFYATLKTFQLSDFYFKNNHSNDGVGNAFRHSLWNALILMYCCKLSSPKKSERWAYEFTTFFEELFKNPALQNSMDLHNNLIGREVFMSLIPTHHRQFVESSFFIPILLEKCTTPFVLVNAEQNYNSQLWVLYL